MNPKKLLKLFQARRHSLSVLSLILIIGLSSCGRPSRPTIEIVSYENLGSIDAPLTDTLRSFMSVIELNNKPIEPKVILNRPDINRRDTFAVFPISWRSKSRSDMNIRELKDAHDDFKAQINTFKNTEVVGAPSRELTDFNLDTLEYDFFFINRKLYDSFSVLESKKFWSLDKLNLAVRNKIIAQLPSESQEEIVSDQLQIKILIVGENLLPSSCHDGIKNGLETDVDCGGPDCIPCCEDGVKNGQEVDVDCGGPDCIPCCEDGVKNNGETGIDCGGPNCPPCPPKIYTLIVNPDGIKDRVKGIQRAVQNIGWISPPHANYYELRFTTKQGKVKEWRINSGNTSSFSLIQLGVGTTDDVWNMTIRAFDSNKRLIGKGGLSNFTISCN